MILAALFHGLPVASTTQWGLAPGRNNVHSSWWLDGQHTRFLLQHLDHPIVTVSSTGHVYGAGLVWLMCRGHWHSSAALKVHKISIYVAWRLKWCQAINIQPLTDQGCRRHMDRFSNMLSSWRRAAGEHSHSLRKGRMSPKHLIMHARDAPLSCGAETLHSGVALGLLRKSAAQLGSLRSGQPTSVIYFLSNERTIRAHLAKTAVQCHFHVKTQPLMPVQMLECQKRPVMPVRMPALPANAYDSTRRMSCSNMQLAVAACIWYLSSIYCFCNGNVRKVTRH